jgi:hypothetical protein
VELDLVSFYRVEIQLNIELWAGYFRAPYFLVCLILGECVAGDNCPNRTHVLFLLESFQQAATSSILYFMPTS